MGNGQAWVTKRSPLSRQVCVPKSWTDAEVSSFAEAEGPSGTEGGWKVRKEGHPDLKGQPERVQCDIYEKNVHVMLDC